MLVALRTFAGGGTLDPQRHQPCTQSGYSKSLLTTLFIYIYAWFCKQERWCKRDRHASKKETWGRNTSVAKNQGLPLYATPPIPPSSPSLLRCYYRRRLFLFRLVTVLQTRRLAQATRDLKQSGQQRIRRLRLKNEFLPSIKISKMTAFVYRLQRRHTSTSA